VGGLCAHDVDDAAIPTGMLRCWLLCLISSFDFSAEDHRIPKPII